MVPFRSKFSHLLAIVCIFSTFFLVSTLKQDILDIEWGMEKGTEKINKSQALFSIA